MFRRRTVMAMLATVVLSACAAGVEPVVDPGLSERLSITDVSVRFSADAREDLALRDKNYVGNFQKKIIDGLKVQSATGDLPAGIVVNVESTRVSASGTKTASGAFTIVNSRNGKALSGPNEFSAVLAGESTPVAGGLVGVVLASAVKGVANASQGPHRRAVEALGVRTADEIKKLIFGQPR